jgi:hypothetical protein
MNSLATYNESYTKIKRYEILKLIYFLFMDLGEDEFLP